MKKPPVLRYRITVYDAAGQRQGGERSRSLVRLQDAYDVWGSRWPRSGTFTVMVEEWKEDDSWAVVNRKTVTLEPLRGVRA